MVFNRFFDRFHMFLMRFIFLFKQFLDGFHLDVSIVFTCFLIRFLLFFKAVHKVFFNVFSRDMAIVSRSALTMGMRAPVWQLDVAGRWGEWRERCGGGEGGGGPRDQGPKAQSSEPKDTWSKSIKGPRAQGFSITDYSNMGAEGPNRPVKSSCHTCKPSFDLQAFNCFFFNSFHISC